MTATTEPSEIVALWRRDAANNICRAQLRYHRARLDNQDAEQCLELENHAEELAAIWQTCIEPEAGPWLAWCEPDLSIALKELEQLEGDTGEDRLILELTDGSFHEVRI
jgi:hypothetical protein